MGLGVWWGEVGQGVEGSDVFSFLRSCCRLLSEEKKKDLCLIHCVWLRTRGRK